MKTDGLVEVKLISGLKHIIIKSVLKTFLLNF